VDIANFSPWRLRLQGPGKEVLAPYKIVKIEEMGGVMSGDSPRHSSPASKLEKKMVEAMKQRALKGTSMKSFNSVIMKFPKIDENLRNCRTIFQQFGELYPLSKPALWYHVI
jgi:hypothetical protein